MRVTVKPVVVDVFRTVPKSLEKSLEESEMRIGIETLQIAALLRSARILKRVMETWGDLLSLTLQ